jgi:hypothetical protein
MAYTTANGVASVAPDPPDASIQVVTDDVEAAQGAPQGRIDRILRTAEGIVRDLAPPPAEDEDPQNEYPRAAADGEVAVFEYLWESKPHLERGTWLDASATYRRDSDKALQGLVRSVMGRFYVGPRIVPPRDETIEPKAVVHNVSDKPLW